MKHISETLPKISATTGQTEPDETKPTSTGRELGKAGSGANLPAVAKRLTVMRPMEIDKALEASLPPAVASRLTSVIHLGPDPGRIGETIDWRIDGKVSEDDARAALDFLKMLMVPADPMETTAELAKMRAVMASRKTDGEDESLIQAVFVEQIEWEGYPIDVVRETCRDLRNLTTFWPTWSEFKERADREFLKRRALYMALRRILSRSSADILALRRKQSLRQPLEPDEQRALEAWNG